MAALAVINPVAPPYGVVQHDVGAVAAGAYADVHNRTNSRTLLKETRSNVKAQTFFYYFLDFLRLFGIERNLKAVMGWLCQN